MASIHLIQMNIEWQNKFLNFRHLENTLSNWDLPKNTPLKQNDLVVLPEMFATGFDVRLRDHAEPSTQDWGETGSFLQELAVRLGIYLLGSAVVHHDEKLLNCVRLFTPQSNPQPSFGKVHPFSFGGEHKRFHSGRSIVLYQWEDLTICPFICYDLRFPELFRAARLAGAQVFLVPANWPAVRQHHWQPLLQARAIENQAYCAGLNRVGKDPFLEYQGQSVIYDFQGAPLQTLGSQEGVCSFTPDVEQLEHWRQSFPVMQDAHMTPESFPWEVIHSVAK
jgi:omega-amidase